MSSKPITTTDIRVALFDRNYPAMRALHDRITVQGLAGATPETTSTINLCLISCALFQETGRGHERVLAAMLDAADEGKHPYDHPRARAVIAADAAIATAQLSAMVDKS